MFWSKPCSLALPRDSPLRVEEPDYQGIKRFMLKLMLFYSKQSKSIRGANVVYQRIISQVDKPPIYEGPFCSQQYKLWLQLRCIYALVMIVYTQKAYLRAYSPICFKFLLTSVWQKMKTRFPGFVHGTLKINSSSMFVMGLNCSLHFPLLFLQLMFILGSLVNIQRFKSYVV